VSADAAPIDYFVLGTVTRDVVAGGDHAAGGTGAFAAATARALGQRVGLCARFADDVDLSALDGVLVMRQPSDVTTTFENRYEPGGRVQALHARASELTLEGVPAAWLQSPIVHLGPLAQDLDPALVERFPGALLGVTPQGWMRAWDADRRVHACDWAAPEAVLQRADAVVLSIEDAGGDWPRIERWATAAKLLVVTDAERGAIVYCRGLRRLFPPPQVDVRDPTGAGDIFAAAYLVEYRARRDPWEAARRAVWLTSMLLAERSGRFPDRALMQRLLAAHDH
jgi:sugar/nucleoside kinase (ribokinase family)